MSEMISVAEEANSARTVRGYCALCTAHCATVATVENGRVVALDADHDHPNGGVICVKGKAAPELVYNPDRLNYPLKRTKPKGDADPGWQRVSWEDALDDIAKRLSAIRNQYGAKALALGKGTRSGTSVADVERWLGRFLCSAVLIGYRPRMSATGTKIPVSVTPSAAAFQRRTWRTAKAFFFGVTIQARRH
jgi:anaerobic selenocysteine-containing dehydrogenase